MNCVPYDRKYLDGIVGLCSVEGWHSYADDSERTHRVLTAPGVTTMVACHDGAVVGFASLQSDGEIQAHLSIILVGSPQRRLGIAKRLLHEALERAGGQRIDLITETAEGFYLSLEHRRMSGYRLYPPIA